MTDQKFELGLVGLGVMGRNLALNVAEHGFSLLGLDTDPAKVGALKAHAPRFPVDAVTEIGKFAHGLRTPRAILLLVPAGNPVDMVIGELMPFLEAGDVVIDSGNSLFKDTDRRMQQLAENKIHFIGMGISGGESGARKGPSLMPGGDREGYERVRPILEAVAARAADGTPCVAYLGKGSAGNYVKMVHNGIEYGLMQLLAETYDVMNRGLGLTSNELAAVYDGWNQSELASFLVSITAQIFKKDDPKTGKRLVEMVVDGARQKGTGKWTAQEAMELAVPAPTIDLSVAMRDLSKLRDERRHASEIIGGPAAKIARPREAVLTDLKDAFHAATIISFAQGLAMLREAKTAHGYDYAEETVARIWRGGCIIRAQLLEDITAAYKANPKLANLMLDPTLAKRLTKLQASLRNVIIDATVSGVPVPCLMACLSYYDTYRSARLPTNLIQAQRDYFGAHTYERLDEPGTFHTEWA